LGSSIKEGRKDFFFEKKKQKTFGHWAEPYDWRARKHAKVFWFFFSKKNCFLPFLTTASPYAQHTWHRAPPCARP
jgi:hypothetical protein